jgi:hypothetical protein
MTAAVPSSLCIDIIDNRAKAVACLDEAVPDDYLVRKIDAVLDLSWVYDRDRRRIWRFALHARPRSADRTRSPAAVSQKREFFKCLPETIGYFAPELPKFGV